MEQLRATRALQVQLEGRLLLVDKAGLEALGLMATTGPAAGPPGVPGVPGTLRTLGGWGRQMKVVDDGQLKALLKTVAGSQGAVAVELPKVMVADGAAVGMRAGSKEVAGGFRMAVRATLSADRRYVVMEIGMDAGDTAAEAAAIGPLSMVSVREGTGALLYVGPVRDRAGDTREGVVVMRATMVTPAKPAPAKGFLEE